MGKVIYEPRGWLSHVRFSPRGDLIAIEDHVPNGDDGRVVILDRQGNIKVASSFFITAQGLAWSPGSEREVWFTASKEGSSQSSLCNESLREGTSGVARPGGAHVAGSYAERSSLVNYRKR